MMDARAFVGTVRPVDLETFNAATRREADAVLLSCCASRRFAAAVTAGRPYPSLAAAEAATSAAFESLTWDDVMEALEHHPRIGARADDGRSAGAGWPGNHGQSAAEQSGVADSDRAALTAANAEYEARFGHIFLICASGLTGGEMLAELRARLGNNPDTERIVATRELQKITVLRLRKALTP
jgi:2-oxo-4-hydroxy-4-carboxy-5-ureidoimidazoline decarboxylase